MGYSEKYGIDDLSDLEEKQFLSILPCFTVVLFYRGNERGTSLEFLRFLGDGVNLLYLKSVGAVMCPDYSES